MWLRPKISLQPSLQSFIKVHSNNPQTIVNNNTRCSEMSLMLVDWAITKMLPNFYWHDSHSTLSWTLQVFYSEVTWSRSSTIHIVFLWAISLNVTTDYGVLLHLPSSGSKLVVLHHFYPLTRFFPEGVFKNGQFRVSCWQFELWPCPPAKRRTARTGGPGTWRPTFSSHSWKRGSSLQIGRSSHPAHISIDEVFKIGQVLRPFQRVSSLRHLHFISKI